MDVVTGTDTSASSAGVDRLLAGIRRLTALADGASDAETIFRALARELLSVPGAEEVHVHHLLVDGADEEELVAVYMFEGNGRLSYLLPRAERPPGVSWVASTGRSFLAADADELAASVPRLTATGRDELRAAAAARRAGRGGGGRDARPPRVRGLRRRARSSSPPRSSTRRPRRSRSCARAPRRAPTRSPAA